MTFPFSAVQQVATEVKGQIDDFKPYIDRQREGEQNILWPTKQKWFAKSSGTTSEVIAEIAHSIHSYKNAQNNFF